jgi:hypothetical protein
MPPQAWASWKRGHFGRKKGFGSFCAEVFKMGQI